MGKNPDFSKVSGRIYKIRCCGDSNSVANMLEDIAEKVRRGHIHGKEELFWELNSQTYVKEENRGEWHDKDIKKIQ